MSDLRTAVEGLRVGVGFIELDHGRPFDPAVLMRNAVLALIPEGSVLVTEDELAGALISDFGRIRHEKAAAILVRIREGQSRD